MDLALNNLKRLICHKTQTINQPANLTAGSALSLVLNLIGNRIGQPTSNPRQGYLHFTLH